MPEPAADAPAAARADLDRAAYCRQAHPMVLAAYREVIARWVRQRREVEVIKAERARGEVDRELGHMGSARNAG
jgi:hypothetical protein